jgi:multidrug efflux pump subunit AcrA (membrane-fusion protein)
MKPKTFPILILIFTIALILVGCKQTPETTPPPITLESSPTSQTIPQSSGFVTASGIIAPTKTAHLGFCTTGRVSEVNIEPGVAVTKGDLLVSLEGRARLEAAVSAAQFELANAQFALDSLYQDTDLLAAQALRAQFDYEQALEDLLNPELQQALALGAIADAQKAIEVAERRFYSVSSRADDADIEEAHATVILAKDKLDKAIEDFEPYADKPESNLRRAALLSKKAAAQQEYNAAVRRYNALRGTGSEADIAVAEADLAKTKAQLIEAERAWERVKEGPNEANVLLLKAQIETAARDYKIYSNGPDPDQVELAQVRVDNALSQLAAAQAAFDEIILIAPFDGIAIDVDVFPGEVVVPGQTVITMSDLSGLRVETTDLSERDVDLVRVGQNTKIYIEALDEEVSGIVTSISPQADTLGGDVVYTVYIKLTQNPHGLRWGMSVEVEIETG